MATPTYWLDPKLKEYATERQSELIDAVNEHRSMRAAAKVLGIDQACVARQVASVKRKAGLCGYAAVEQVEDSPITTTKTIMVLPDAQAKPGVDFSYLRRIGLYMVEKKPDIVVCIGDFADMPSLSSYDKGKKAFEGRRYKRDVEAAQFAMQAFLGPMWEHNKTAKVKYTPRMVLTLGNHEERINRAINDDAKLDGVLSIKDLAYEEYGWEVVPFLEVIVIEGIAFSHYFTTGVMGRPAGTAQAQLRKAGMSCIAGHQQGKQIAYSTRADGSTVTSIIAGSCYEHLEDFLGAQGNKHWRGFLMCHEVKDGAFDEMWVSLGYINQRYSAVKVDPPIYSIPTADEIAAGRC
ncbi:hypothetical protein M8A51_23615 [Schlegelella sp. S2-27]|uniref:Calcineurin-like phosphoesterase n=1 Tax=Caldimonas mangrovi TaxID=2944811 RepID=A0ABT0YVU8_9BURK|nr:LysR family transcriptional regulator [Caldimonas mangrovi]MCM5682529.1 hypothetical protein [Caldimonas mangrovi]